MEDGDGDQQCQGMRYVSLDDLRAINDHILDLTTPEELKGVLKPNELETAQRAPSATRFYENTEDMALLAAILLERLIRNHPFRSGNKRTAFVATRVFLRLNGYVLAPPMGEVVDLCQDIAEGLHKKEGIAWWIAQYTQEADPSMLFQRDFVNESNLDEAETLLMEELNRHIKDLQNQKR